MKDEDYVFVSSKRNELKKQKSKKVSYSREILAYAKASISSKIVVVLWLSAVSMGLLAYVLTAQGKDVEAYALVWMLVAVFFMMDP